MTVPLRWSLITNVTAHTLRKWLKIRILLKNLPGIGADVGRAYSESTLGEGGAVCV